ncbi:hypothetical protein M8J75_015964 [Diaphorina citri]|nr:hypothetical protein M8J75_015964 [Diaphorina citri]
MTLMDAILLSLQKPSFWYACFIITYVFYLWSRRKQYVLSWQLAGPLAFPLIGNSYFVLDGGVSNVINKMHKAMRDHWSPCRMVRLWVGQSLHVFVGDASIAYQVNKIPHKPDFYKYLGGLYVSKGLVSNIDSHHWKLTRKLMQPSFSYQSIKSFTSLMHEKSLQSVRDFDKYATTGESFYIAKVVRYYPFETITKSYFDYDLKQNDRDYIESIMEDLKKMFKNRISLPIFKNLFVYWLVGLRQKENKVMKNLLGFVHNVIDSKKSKIDSGTNVKSEKNFVDTMLEKPDIYMDEVIQQAGTLIAASIDTTAFQLSALLLMLALHSEIQKNLYKEVIEVLGEDVTKPYTYEQLMSLDYLNRVFKECLRMFPAVPFTAKMIYEDMKVTADDGEYTIPAGTIMVIMQISIHNSPDYYDNPQVFNPDRWLPDQVSTRNPHCFLPFSNGPRNCIGQRYTTLGIKAFAVNMVRTFEILPSEQCPTMADVKIEVNTTLDFKHNCQIRLRRRNN